MVEFNDEGLSLPIDMGDGAAADADKPVVREVTAADMAALAEVEAELDQRLCADLAGDPAVCGDGRCGECEAGRAAAVEV